MYLILLHRDGTRAITYGGAHGDPSPPYTGTSGGGGTHKIERTWSAQSCDLLRHCAARSCDHSRAERGGDPPRHRSRGTREMRALGLLGPMPRLDSKYTWITHLFSVHTWQAHIQPRGSFFAYSALNINFKGVPVYTKLKIVALAISVE